jgi:hypothetical protein
MWQGWKDEEQLRIRVQRECDLMRKRLTNVLKERDDLKKERDDLKEKVRLLESGEGSK